LTYHELDLKSSSLARGLKEIGVAKGDRVAVSLGNNIEFAIVRPWITIREKQNAE
jgi:non-ribosomal peptide synthetase component E (peptide arylation enzyme)